VKRFSFKDESGLTLVEILVAMAIIMVGLAAVMQAFPVATQGTEAGRRQSTADFLAEEKLEQIKAWSLSTCTGPPGCAVPQGFTTVVKPGGTCANAGNPCADDAFDSIPGYAGYSRTVIVQGNPPAPTANTRLVRVTVSYRRVTSAGVSTGATVGTVSVETLVGQR